jgi:hypothetical protein
MNSRCDSVLEMRLREHHIAEVLSMSAVAAPSSSPASRS